MDTEILNLQHPKLKSKISHAGASSAANTQKHFQWPKRALLFVLFKLGLAAYGVCYGSNAWNLRTDGSIGLASTRMRRGVTLRAKRAMTPVLAITLGLDKSQTQVLILSSSLILLSIVLAVDMLTIPALSLTIAEIAGCLADTLDGAYFLTIYVSCRDALAYFICSVTQLVIFFTVLETYLWFGLLEYLKEASLSNS